MERVRERVYDSYHFIVFVLLIKGQHVLASILSMSCSVLPS